MEVIGLGATIRDAAHSTLFAAFSETEKPYPTAIENINTAAHVGKSNRTLSSFIRLFLESAEERSRFTCPEALHVQEAGIS